MEKVLMLICPFSSSQSFLSERMPNRDLRFVTSYAGVFSWEDANFVDMPAGFLIKENIKQIFFVQDLHSRALLDAIHDSTSNQNNTVKYITDVFSRNQTEINLEQGLSRQISKLSLFVIEDQVTRLTTNLTLQRMIQEHKITVNGMLSEQSRAKSIEFSIQPDLQLS